MSVLTLTMNWKDLMWQTESIWNDIFDTLNNIFDNLDLIDNSFRHF